MCPGEETVAAYVAGQLPRDERNAIDSHFDTCNACQELVAALAKSGAAEARDGASEGMLASGVSTLGVGLETSTWAPGGQLGRYVLLARLGAGGMGVVYTAYDPELDRRVALKVLRHARAGDELREEARAIARLAHPNVVAVHDVGRADGELFVAMEHVEGVTVREWLLTRRTRAEILDVFVQAGRGLAAAHRVGLVHRDVKPSNIIIGTDMRARVLDFGLARTEHDDDPAIAGTPAYMAPEQRAGAKITARADQFALCVAVWEALGGTRPTADLQGTLEGVPDRITRALRRGLATSPDDRFETIDDLLRELSPVQRRARRWVIATVVALAALATTLVLSWSHARVAPSCARAGEQLTAAWADPQRAALRAAFKATGLDYASGVAETTIAELDQWAVEWQRSAEASCRATIIDRVQPAELHALRQGCLDELDGRLRVVVALTVKPDPMLVASADHVAASLPSPSRCDDVAALAALPPLPPAEHDRAEVAALRSAIDAAELGLVAGRANDLASEVEALHQRAEALPYLPVRARGTFLVGQYEVSRAHYAQGIVALHAAAQAAAEARDLEQLADTWIYLTEVLGNDLRTADQADIFDGYARALIRQLPDHAGLQLKLELARCNRNTSSAGAAAVGQHCEAAIEMAERARPPRPSVINSARTRLGHFQRLSGDPALALATLHLAVAEAVRVYGPHHPDTAVAHFALGTALADDKPDEAIAELRQSLEIRRAAFPGGSLPVAESLLGLGDALSTKGHDAEAIVALDDALAILDKIHESESPQAVNAHVMIGMALEQVKRAEQALPHYLRAADITERSEQHREAVTAMALRLAASVEANHDHAGLGVLQLERALRLLERGKASPADLGKTQYDLSELLLAIKPPDLPRARAMAETARASLTAAGPAGAEDLALTEKFMHAHHWQ